MGEQKIMLVIIILSVVATIGLYAWRAVRQIVNKNDERWIFVKVCSYKVREIANWIFILGLFVMLVHPDLKQLVVSSGRIVFGGLVYFGICNLFELFGLIYFERKL